MEIKSVLQKPYTEEERMEFIIIENHNQGFEIRETETELQSWGYTEEEKQEQERLRKDAMTLTPADVERALYRAKGMDFTDLKELIASTATGIDLKALNIEFNASMFYRGAPFGNGKLFDVVGNLLGYTPEDIDYLFEHKELPQKEEPEEVDEEQISE